MKAIVQADGDTILGFSTLGAQVGKMVAGVQVAMWGKLPYTALREGILAHPTMAERLNLLFSNVSTPTSHRVLVLI
jgi:probable pyridine nucleotide-disulfide oxidoreductase